MRQKLPILLCLFSVCAVVAGCARPSSRIDSGKNALKVALLSPGPINDNGWNAIAYEGLKAVEKELGAAISQKQTEGPADFEADFREYASQDYDVIIGHGFELQPAAIKVSKDFPNTVFIVTAGNKVEGKVVPIIPKLEEATYLMGVVAARMSKAGKAGLVGGMEIPPIKSTFEAFRRGALSVRKDFRTVDAYIGNWDDTASAKEATNTLISQGCDFIFHNADAAGRGVIQACEEHPGVWAFGSNSNQNSLGPDTVLASAVLEVPKTFVEICKTVRDGTFRPAEHRLTIANGHTSLVFNDKLEGRVPKSVMDEIEKLSGKLRDGSLKVERAHF